jgi:hypothetical protein
MWKKREETSKTLRDWWKNHGKTREKSTVEMIYGGEIHIL